MSASSETLAGNPAITHAAGGKHPKGLYVLFAAEMWERFSFYSMLAMFTLYLQDPTEGFEWTTARATGLYANYLMFVYASPLIGGWLADKKLGYRKAVMIGGLFFIAGHLLLSIPALPAVYAALTCLVVGNGFFKPNVSTMVGNLYPEGSHLKDRAYNIFYMGINVGALAAPLVAAWVQSRFGFHPAFAVAAGGMVVSVWILWQFKKHIEEPRRESSASATHDADTAAITTDAPPASVSQQKQSLMESVPERRRITALIVIFLVVIVFWMVFHQNGSTLTYWANDNTDWSALFGGNAENAGGIISNAINPFWVIVLTFPLVFFWKLLDDRGLEPSTPTKMAFGMTLTGLSFFVLFFAAKTGEAVQPQSGQYATASFRINERVLDNLRAGGLPEDVGARLGARAISEDVAVRLRAEGVAENVIVRLQNEVVNRKFALDGELTEEQRRAGAQRLTGEQKLTNALRETLGAEQAERYREQIFRESYLFQLSPFWLIFSYFVVTLGELMLSPMGLSLVSKVAPYRLRGLLMGGWFVATAIGNKLTMIGVYWDQWLQSNFFAILGAMALFMAVVLFLLLKPLKKAMPGV